MDSSRPNQPGENHASPEPEACLRMSELLDHYVFSRDTLSSDDILFLNTHLATCTECRAKYRELLKWKNLMQSARYEAPPELRNAVLSYVEEEQKKSLRYTVFRKKFTRITVIAASFAVFLTAIVIVAVIRKSSPIFDTAASGADGATPEAYSERTVAQTDNGNFDENTLTKHILREENIEEKTDGVDKCLPETALVPSLFAAPEETAEPKLEANLRSEAAEDMSADEDEEQIQETALTSMAKNPSQAPDEGIFFTALYSLYYVEQIAGEEAVQLWSAEQNTSITVTGLAEDAPPLYNAIVAFDIDRDTLSALDTASVGMPCYLGETVIEALYEQNWTALLK